MNSYTVTPPALCICGEIATGKATIRSLGMAYAFAIANAAALEHAGSVHKVWVCEDFWRAVNEPIIAFAESTGKRDPQKYLNAVKTVGWEIHEAACADGQKKMAA